MARFESRHSFLIRGAEAFLRLEVGLVSAPGEGDDGAVLREDFPAHRAYVGAPEEWEPVASRQVSLLLAAGLRDTHRLVDVGCGSLRAGRMLIPYLRPDHYFGVEPNRWLVEKGIENELGRDLIRIKRPTFRYVDDFSPSAFGVSFDFALALTGFRGIAEALAPEGKLFATFKEGPTSPAGSGWLYPEMVPYTWERMSEIVEESGLVARRLDWMQPRQSWFVAAHPNAEGDIDDLSRRLRRPLPNPKAGTA